MRAMHKKLILNEIMSKVKRIM